MPLHRHNRAAVFCLYALDNAVGGVGRGAERGCYGARRLVVKRIHGELLGIENVCELRAFSKGDRVTEPLAILVALGCMGIVLA